MNGAASCHPDRPARSRGLCEACYQTDWKIRTGRDTRPICVCGCGLPARNGSAYRRGHLPKGWQASESAPDDVIAPPSFRKDENGVWYYWWPKGQERKYGVRVGTCIGCGAAFLTRHMTRDRYCTNSCAAVHRPHRSGAQCYNWNGGRWKNPAGYVQCRIPGTRKTVLEHRLVMERFIGRPLLAHENVHHINGNKADNRLENLELWSSSQPSGQRVLDKVTWAREILELYGDLWDRAALAVPDAA